MMINMPFIDELIFDDEGSFLPLWLFLFFDFMYYFEGRPGN